MGRRILNRKEMRADFDAAERRGKEEEERDEDEEEEDEDEDEDEEDGEAGDDEGEDDDDAAGEDDEDEDGAPKKKKKKKKVVAAPKPKAKPRSRAAKVVRMRVVWGVFSNSNQCVATYEYPKREQAVEHAAKLTADKRSTHFVQPVKEPMEAKKEKEK
jgi:cobalamin biosynthesis protein CobT